MTLHDSHLKKKKKLFFESMKLIYIYIFFLFLSFPFKRTQNKVGWIRKTEEKEGHVCVGGEVVPCLFA